MFKGLKGGMRRSGGGGASGSGRISGLHGLRGSSTEVSRRRRPAFTPDTPEEQAFDSSSSRVSEPGGTKQGWTGKGMGA